MCARDDDPSQHDAPRVAPLFCEACGHAWRSHMTMAHRDVATRLSVDSIPCIGSRHGLYCLHLCGCEAVAPETTRYAVAGHM